MKPLTEFEQVDFDVEREQWNKYRLDDKTILKTKFVLINVFFEKGFKAKAQKVKGMKDKFPVGFRFQSSNVIGVQVQSNVIGTPDNRLYTYQELQAFVTKEDMDFQTINETWNIYRLPENVVMKVKISPVDVKKTSKFDTLGIPIYLVESSADIKIGPRR